MDGYLLEFAAPTIERISITSIDIEHNLKELIGLLLLFHADGVEAYLLCRLSDITGCLYFFKWHHLRF